MEIKQRLDILKMSGQLSEEMYYKVMEIIDMFNENHRITIQEENGAMLITHLCIALQRIEKEESVNIIESEIFAEVEENRFYKQSSSILEKMEEIQALLCQQKKWDTCSCIYVFFLKKNPITERSENNEDSCRRTDGQGQRGCNPAKAFEPGSGNKNHV